MFTWNFPEVKEVLKVGFHFHSIPSLHKLYPCYYHCQGHNHDHNFLNCLDLIILINLNDQNFTVFVREETGGDGFVMVEALS